MIEDLRAALEGSDLDLPATGTAVIPVIGTQFAYIGQFKDGELIGAVLLHEDIGNGLINMLFQWLEEEEDTDGLA